MKAYEYTKRLPKKVLLKLIAEIISGKTAYLTDIERIFNVHGETCRRGLFTDVWEKVEE